jgi:hypothetical protein
MAWPGLHQATDPAETKEEGDSQMNKLDEKQMQVQVPVVAWLLITLNLIVLLVAAALLMVTTSIAGLVRDPEARVILPLVGTILPALMGALTVPDFIAAIGLLARQRWGRILGIVVGFLNLPGFPMGTLVGGYAIYVLMQDSAKSYFDSPKSRFEGAPRPA